MLLLLAMLAPAHGDALPRDAALPDEAPAGRAARDGARLDITGIAPPNFQDFTGRDGLSDEIWSTVGFDRRGFVWAGSASGLAVFDGYRWEPWPLPAANSLVRDMASAPDGTLWAIFEREGLARYDGSTWQLTDYNGFNHRFSTLVTGTTAPALWAAQDDDIRRLEGDAWVRDGAYGTLPVSQALALARTDTLFDEPREWVLRRGGEIFYRIAGAARSPWRQFGAPELEGFRLFTDAHRTHDRGREELWFTSYGHGIARITREGIRTWYAQTGELPSSAIYSAVSTHDDDGTRSLWLATRAGLVRMREGRIDVFDRGDGLPSDAVRGLKVQRETDGGDVLWLATEGGLARARLEPGPWRTVSRLGASENGIFGVVVEPDGRGGQRVFVGSSREGLAMLSEAGWRRFDVAGGALPTDEVHRLFRVAGPDGGRWLLVSLGDGALLRITDALAVEPLATPWGSDDVAISAVSQATAHGTVLWVGTRDSGLYRFDGLRWAHVVPPRLAGKLDIQSLQVQPLGGGRSVLWVAGTRGLARLAGDRLVYPAAAAAAAGSGYRSLMLLDRRGRTELWASSFRHGLVRFDVSAPAAARLLADDDVPPPPDPTIYSTKADSRGRIYVCTNNGVQLLVPSADGAYAQRIFRRRDGLVHDECNTGSQFVDAHDRFWVGTLAGLSVYDPALEVPPSRRPAPALHVTQVVLDGRITARLGEVGGTLEVPAGTREIAVYFALLSNERERESRYRTQLLGYDEGPGAWTAERARYFGSLPPGAYELLIEGHDHAGVASVPQRLSVTVLPFWWQRRSVQVSGVLLLAMLCAAGAMLYNRRVRRREGLLERTVARRTAELNAANEKLTELSFRDPLTGLANRRSLGEAARRVFAEGAQAGRPVGLIVLDIDEFKHYNDRFGHLVGDDALKCVARILEDNVREGDTVARFGGEEFACLLPGADAATAYRIAERMRAQVALRTAEELAAPEHALTFSAGAVAEVPGPGTRLSDLLSQADQALYTAKRAGRNRVRSATLPAKAAVP